MDQFDVGGGRSGVKCSQNGVPGKGVGDYGVEFDNQLAVHLRVAGRDKVGQICLGGFLGGGSHPLISLAGGGWSS